VFAPFLTRSKTKPFLLLPKPYRWHPAGCSEGILPSLDVRYRARDATRNSRPENSGTKVLTILPMTQRLLPTKDDDYRITEPFGLESGVELSSAKLRYTIYGELNEQRDNAVLVFHALTGWSRIAEWWGELIGEGKALDTSQYAFICANYLGSCYGSTSADEINSIVTTRDVVRSQVKLLDYLKISRLKAVIGGSLGGQLALQTAVDFPDLAEKCIVIAACELSAMGLALNHLQREAIKQTGDIGLARQIAMLSYKCADLFDAKFARNPNRNGENPRRSLPERFDIAGYLDYQADIFRKRFDAPSYNLISKMMDLFEIADEEIRQIKAEVMLVGISTDWLYPASDVKRLAERLQTNGVNARYVEMVSPDGHDAFLSDTAKMSAILREIMSEPSAAAGG
jgi:homoserine O-acetyltransferase/O-succinyltransferase